MSSKPVILILGSGPRVGASIAEQFSKDGYQVVLASRKGTNQKIAEGYFSIQADLSDASSIPKIFQRVNAELHTYPQVVVYNAASLTPPTNGQTALSIPGDSVTKDLMINTVAPFVAAQEAVKGWDTLPKEAKRTFIYTGNALNAMVLPVPTMTTLGMGKAASAYWVGVADMTHSANGYRFFYADERSEAGKLKGAELDGAAHAEFYAQLAKHVPNMPWHATFVQGQGYVRF